MPITSSCRTALPAPVLSSPVSSLESDHGLCSPITRDAGKNFGLGSLGSDPGRNPDPLARLEILVVLEEMRDLPGGDLRQIARRLDCAIEPGEFVGRHREDLGISARLVVPFQ